MNLENFVNKVIDQNEEIFDNFCSKIVDRNYQMDTEIIMKYLEKVKCNTKSLEFKSDLIKNVKLIECNEFDRIINNNIEEIKKLSDSYDICIPVGKNDMIKSNFFYTLLTIYKLKKKGVNVEIFYNSHEILEKYNKKENKLIVISDDVSYSGNQLASHINSKITDGLNNSFYVSFDESKKLNIGENKKFFLNIIGYTAAAKATIEKQFKNSDLVLGKLIFGRSVIFFDYKNVVSSVKNYLNTKYGDNYRNLLKLYDSYSLIKDGEEIKVIKEKVINDNYLNLSLIILFQKYPDAQSTYPELCRLNSLDEGRIFINVEKLHGNKENALRFLNSINSKWVENSMPIEEFILDETKRNFIKLNFSDKTKLSQIPFLEICQNNDKEELEWTYPTIGDDNIKIVKTIKNGEYNNNPRSCLNGSIKSFYKELEFNLDGKVINTNKSIDKYLESLEDSVVSSDESSKKYYKLYLKYKNKYLNLKKLKNIN